MSKGTKNNMDYIGKRMFVDTQYADGNVHFHEDYFEFLARNRNLSCYDLIIRYEDIDKIEQFNGIKKTVIITTKDSKRHFFYMYKMATFVALINAGIHKDVPSEESKKDRAIDADDLNRLSQLNELHKSGVLSDEEFETQKNLIMEKYR